MALLEIVKYPNPVLELPGEPVVEFDKRLQKLVADMFETMYEARGVGLAAPQMVVAAQDIRGEHFEIDGMELTARCMLHETDHCDGIVFINHTTPLKREMVKR